MKIRFNGKIHDISVTKVSVIVKFTGLMFRTSDTDNLLFEFGKFENTAIHSFFVFFPFVAVWLDSKGKVVGIKIVDGLGAKIQSSSDLIARSKQFTEK